MGLTAARGVRLPKIQHPRRRSHLVYVVVAVALFMSSVDQTMVATALPTIGRELRAGVNWSAWTMSVYSLSLIVAMPLGGKLSDELGRKKVFLSAVVVFMVSSLACGLAPNIYFLVACRAIQALGAGVFLPAATGIIADEFPDNRDRAVGSFASIFPIGAIVGPVIGGFIVDMWSWRWMFLVNVPIGLLLIYLGMKFMRPSPRNSTVRIDWRGIVLLGGALLCTMYAFARIGDGHEALAPSLAVLAASGVLMLIFLRHSARSPKPFVPIALLRGRIFGVMNGLNFIFGSAGLAIAALAPLYAQDRYGIDIVSSGTMLTARAVGIISVSGLTVMVMRWTGYRLPMVVGYFIVAIGLIMMYMEPAFGSAYLWLAIATGIGGVGFGLFIPPANNATLHVDPTQIAAVTGLRGMFRQTGFLIGLSIYSTILARSDDPGTAQAQICLALGIVVLAVIPLIFVVPDHRGKW